METYGMSVLNMLNMLNVEQTLQLCSPANAIVLTATACGVHDPIATADTKAMTRQRATKSDEERREQRTDRYRQRQKENSLTVRR